jgi:hypothetical protein
MRGQSTRLCRLHIATGLISAPLCGEAMTGTGHDAAALERLYLKSR